MTDEMKIKTAITSLILAIGFEVIFSFTRISERAHNILWGLELILVLVALGISAKMVGNFGATKTQKTLAKIMLFLAGILGIYAFIL